MLYDYYGFPGKAYEIDYPAPGNPAMAEKIASMLEHLLPLHVCAGMADKPAQLVFDDHILKKRAVAFLW